MSEQRKHHEFSPSQLQALECCPSYEGQQSSSLAAETGTRQHAVTETGEDDSSLSDEEAAAAALAMQFISQQKQLLGEVMDLREVYLPVDDENTTAGYADRILITADKKKAVMVDYKFGKWPVPPAKENRQSDAYALGIFHAYPTVEFVDVHFFQPSVKEPNNTTWTRADVPELLLRVKTIVARAKAARAAGDFAAAKPTTPVCLFCKHLASCPAVAEKVISVAKKFSPIDVPADLTPTRVHSPEEATVGLRLASLVESWAKAFKNLVTDRCLRGGPLPNGYELTSRATREVVDTERFKQIALMFLTEAEFSTTIDVAVTKVEKIISNKAPRGQKSQTIEAFQAATEDAGAVKKRQPFAFLKQKAS